MAQPVSATRPRNIASRSLRRPIEYGDALRFTTTSAPARACSATGPSGNQTSSQIDTPIRTPATTWKGKVPEPGLNHRCSSKTP
jgi:hypothetical protein